MLVQKAGQAVVDKIDLEEEEKKLQEEIEIMEKKINDDSAMITSLEAEIQELKIENSDQLKRLLEEEKQVKRINDYE